MKLFSFEKAERFYKKHNQAKVLLLAWKSVIEENNFKHLVDLQRIFKSAESVKEYTVFNMGGNKFRLITINDYSNKIVIVKYVKTHEEYNKWKGLKMEFNQQINEQNYNVANIVNLWDEFFSTSDFPKLPQSSKMPKSKFEELTKVLEQAYFVCK